VQQPPQQQPQQQPPSHPSIREISSVLRGVMPDLQNLRRWYFWLSLLRKLGLTSFMGLAVIGVLMGAKDHHVIIVLLVYRAIISILSDWLSDGLTRVCMRDNEPEILSVLRNYNSKKTNERDDPVERACDLSKQYSAHVMIFAGTGWTWKRLFSKAKARNLRRCWR